MQELFARAASLLIGNEVDAAGDHDARHILQALEYASESAAGLIRRPRIASICLSLLPDLRGCSNWPRPMRQACSALARNSIQRLPILA
jgi:hypothetical protein